MDEPTLEHFDALVAHADLLRQRLRDVIVGQEQVIDRLIAALICQGHVLVIGVPGLAKTMLVRQSAMVLGWDYARIQFTPDMMPSDVVGAEVVEQDVQSQQRQMRFLPGPIFAQLVLADEINRTPPRTQAALLEAMAERQVTAAGQTRALPEPFVVIATQNPIEQEGTYPLPEAQLDRFMFSVHLDYPDAAAEKRIYENYLPGGMRIDRDSDASGDTISVTAEQWAGYRAMLGQMPIAGHVMDRALGIVRGTRPDQAPEDSPIARYVQWGAGPRAGQDLVLAGRAVAAMAGRSSVEASDIEAVAEAVLGHRLVLNYAAVADGIDARQLIRQLVRS